jgi:putative solute:sodium symporter small subunit
MRSRVFRIVRTRAGGKKLTSSFSHSRKGGTLMATITAANREAHWTKTRNLMIGHLVIWFIFSFVVHWFAPELNKVSFLDFPLGFYMAAQGSLIVFVVQLFVFAKQQERIDREFGVAEED